MDYITLLLHFVLIVVFIYAFAYIIDMLTKSIIFFMQYLLNQTHLLVIQFDMYTFLHLQACIVFIRKVE